MPALTHRHCAIASAVLAIVVFSAARAQATSIVWNEIGDAGNPDSPQLLTGGPYDQIEGDVGAIDNLVTDGFDAYAFRWSTAGRFDARYVPGDIPNPDRDLLLYLFRYGQTSFGSEITGAFGTPGISVANLETGDYVLLVDWAPSSEDDPHYIIDVTGPTATPLAPLDAINAVPEPSTLILMSGGIAALMRRRRSR
jgi:hypothetical protein